MHKNFIAGFITKLSYALLIFAMVVGLSVGLNVKSAQAAQSIVVSPPNLNGWHASPDDPGNGKYGLVSGPNTPPLGSGSAHLWVGDGTGRPMFYTFDYAGTLLSQIEKLEYQTYSQPSNPDGFAPALQFDVDYDSTDANTAWQGRLVFEPSYNGTVVKGAWQTWDAINSRNAKWYATGAPGKAACPMSGSCTLAQILTLFPNASIRPASVFGRLIIKAGGGWTNFDGNFDALTIKLAGSEEKTFDFEQAQTVYVNSSWSGVAQGMDPDGTGPATSFGLDSFSNIQDGIDAVAAGGTVNVYPGNYSESATNRTPVNIGGIYTFGLFIGHDKDGITVQGVDASGIPVADYNNILANVETNATDNFGPDGVYVDGDNVTLSGLKIWQNVAAMGYTNKTVAVTGNNFTLKNSHITVAPGDSWGSLYFGDEQYDQVNKISHIQTYTIDANWFDNVSMDFNNGAGETGAVSGRLITNNLIDPQGETYATVSFTGSNTGVAWFIHGVGGAVITGNHFQNGTQYIRARGDYDNSQFDWAAFWNNNTFDKAAVVGANPPADLREYSYPYSSTITMHHVRRIGALIQGEVDNGIADDTILVKPGTYTEQVSVGKSLKLVGAGMGQSIIKAPASLPVASDQNSVIVKFSGAGVNAEFSGFTVAGPGPSGCGSMGAGIVVRDGAYANIHNNQITDIRDSSFSGCQNGVGIIVGRSSWSTTGTATITDNQIDNFQKNGIVISNSGSSAVITNNIVTGAGPTAVTAQNGIQVSSGSSATITGNTISGISYIPGTWVATSLLLYGDVNTTNNTINNGQVAIYHIDGSGTHDGNQINASAAGTGVTNFWGIIADDPAPTRQPAPLDDPAAVKPSGNKITGMAPVGDQVVVVKNNHLVGDHTPASYAIEADAGYGARNIDFTVTGNTVENWGVGLEVYQCTSGCTGSVFTRVVANHNKFIGMDLVVENASPITVDARDNYWGTLSWYGYSTIKGIQNRYSGNVLWEPWMSLNLATSYTKPSVTYADVLNVGKAEGEAGASGGTFGYDAFVTITDAINHVTAGGTVNVAAGTYTETLKIDKALTLKGANKGLLAKGRTGPESVILFGNNANNPIEITSDDVTIDGFTLDGTAHNTPWIISAINGQADGHFDNLKVLNNVFVGNPGSGTYPGGMYLWAARNAQIEGNYFNSLGQHAVFMAGGSDGTIYRNNDSLNCYNSNFSAHDAPHTNALIEGNRAEGDNFIMFYLQDSIVRNNTLKGGKIYLGGNGQRVELSSNTFTDPTAQAIIVVNSGFTPLTNSDITIKNNVINSNVSKLVNIYGLIDLRQVGGTNLVSENRITLHGILSSYIGSVYGIRLRGAGLGTVNVLNNELDGGSVTGSASPAVSGLYIQSNDATAGAIPSSASIQVANNIISGFTNAVSVYDAVSNKPGNLATGTSLMLLQNSLADVNGVLNAAAPSAAVQALHNWWGAASGPTHVSNPGGTGAAITDNVTYDPWLCSGIDTHPEVIGFQPSTAGCTALPVRLVFKTQPGNGLSNQPLDPQPVVVAEDAQGNLAINFNQEVALMLLNANGANLLGVTNIFAVHGVATFSGLSLDKPGVDYKLWAINPLPMIGTSATFNVAPVADLAITHGTIPATINAGDNWTIDLLVKNLGPQAADSLVVTDTLPADTTFVSASGTGWDCQVASGVLSCTRSTLAVGDAPLITVVVKSPTTGGTLVNTANVTSNTADVVAANNTSSGQTVAVVVPVSAEIKMYIPMISNHP